MTTTYEGSHWLIQEMDDNWTDFERFASLVQLD